MRASGGYLLPAVVRSPLSSRVLHLYSRAADDHAFQSRTDIALAPRASPLSLRPAIILCMRLMKERGVDSVRPDKIPPRGIGSCPAPT